MGRQVVTDCGRRVGSLSTSRNDPELILGVVFPCSGTPKPADNSCICIEPSTLHNCTTYHLPITISVLRSKFDEITLRVHVLRSTSLSNASRGVSVSTLDFLNKEFL